MFENKKIVACVKEGDHYLFWSPSSVIIREELQQNTSHPELDDHQSDVNDKHMGQKEAFSIDRDYGHQKRYKELSASFSYPESHTRIIHDYTIDSRAINSHLFNSRTRPESTPYKTLGELMRSPHTPKETTFHDFDSIIDSHKTPHDIHVYHGFHANLNDTVKDSPVLYKSPSYMSTSIDPSVARKFGKPFKEEDGHSQHVLEIHVPKGTSALVPGQHSSLRAEREVILPRDSKIVIHPHPQKFADGIHLWKATLL